MSTCFSNAAYTGNDSNDALFATNYVSVNVTSSANEICLKCNISTSACVAVYHLCSELSAPFLQVQYLNKNLNHHTKFCFGVTPGCYWIAVFQLREDDSLDEYPLIVKMIHVKGIGINQVFHIFKHCQELAKSVDV